MSAVPYLVSFLIIFPMVIGFLLFLIPSKPVRKVIASISVALIVTAAIWLTVVYFLNGAEGIWLFEETEIVDKVILVAEIVLMVFITIMCFRYKKYWISLLSIIPTGLMIWTELRAPKVEMAHIYIDNLSILMCLIIAVVGGCIAIYAMGYMDGYHEHHTDVPERRKFFFMVVFLFLGAMFGFVFSDSLMWIDLFWEITSVCSFLLIGYTKTEEAINNSFRALWMNLLGGLFLAVGIMYLAFMNDGQVSLVYLVSAAWMGIEGTYLPVAFIAFAALTKSAQLPFSTWLMGAMVAPTPSSALLHSATMVKAGIYVLFRLAPALSGTVTGTIIAVVGGFTFLMTSIMAIAQTDAKKVLALSTVSNLGLMVACAGMGTSGTIWAGIFLMMFHSVSKALLFMDVGAVENSVHSRDIEDMHGLLYRLPRLTFFMFIGIVAMYLAPFGMLVSKWSALKASVDSNNIILVLLIVFGSAITGFYWTKWLGKLIGRTAYNRQIKDITKSSEMFSLTINAVLMVLLCLLFPFLSSSFVDPLVVQLYGTYQDVIPGEILYILIICVIVTFAVPIVCFLANRKRPFDQKLAYMGGINEDYDNSYTDSYGEKEKLWLTNYYFAHKIGQRKLMIPSQLIALAALVIMISRVIGGAF